jgi:3-hydroxyisobutyrate dehydrogenase-like beta-hydroxyacid dehydrogenase
MGHASGRSGQEAVVDSSRIGFVGAGRMGLAMVERLAAAGHDLVVYVRRPETRAALEQLGVAHTSELRAAAAGADALLICVFNDEQLAEIAGLLAEALPAGAVLASHVTGRESTLRTVARRYPGIDVVDAPVSGGPVEIRAGELTVLLGGPPSARSRAAAVVRAYADPIIETGELGTALAVKLVNNLLFAANAQLAAEAVRLGTALGLAPEPLLGALNQMSGSSQASRRAAEGASMAAFAARIAPFLRKDVATCLEQAAERGVDPGLLIEVARRGPLAVT